MSEDPTHAHRELLVDALGFARERDYSGNDYSDGMSSAVRQALPFETKWVNLLFQESVKRSPIDIRPYLLVERRRNYKGAGLFAMANLNAHRLTGVERYESEARQLVEWLITNRSRGFSGFCGGHKHAIQHLDGRIGRPNNPDAVSTLYAVMALLSASHLNSRYAETALTAGRFVFEDLDYHEIESGARINYTPEHTDDHFTINAVALGARILLELYDHLQNEAARTGADASELEYDVDVLRERATKILDYVASKQTDLGGWMYRDPPSASHLSMDNHHNGFIVEALLRYHDVIDSARYADELEAALAFYRETLFDDDGAPNWSETSAYPKDIHAAAQGIIVFARTGDFDFVERILEWTVANLYGGNGQFYHRKHRFYTRRITLMRWCQAWMAYAISEYLLKRTREDVTSDTVRTVDRV